MGYAPASAYLDPFLLGISCLALCRIGHLLSLPYGARQPRLGVDLLGPTQP